MSAFTLAVVAAIVGLLIGTALVPGAPIFALPIVAILIVVLGPPRCAAAPARPQHGELPRGGGLGSGRVHRSRQADARRLATGSGERR